MMADPEPTDPQVEPPSLTLLQSRIKVLSAENQDLAEELSHSRAWNLTYKSMLNMRHQEFADSPPRRRGVRLPLMCRACLWACLPMMWMGIGMLLESQRPDFALYLFTLVILMMVLLAQDPQVNV